MSEPIRLTPVDHVLIHACGALLTNPFELPDRARDDEMIRQVLNDVLIDVNVDNPALAPFLVVARELAHAQTPHMISLLRSKHAHIVRDFHRSRCAHAFDLVRERYRGVTA